MRTPDVADHRDHPVAALESPDELKIFLCGEVVPLVPGGIGREEQIPEARVIQLRQPAEAVELQAETRLDELVVESIDCPQVCRRQRHTEAGEKLENLWIQA